MLRIFGKSTLLAALVAALSLGLLATPIAAQDTEVQQEFQLSDYPAEGEDGQTCPTCNGGNCKAGCRGGHCGGHNQTNCRPRYYGQPELFHNYYIPGTCGGVPAAMYLSPQPVPAMVGHTYITYQPLMPHEMLYQHKRTYYRYYNGGRGLTRTSVKWSRPPLTGWTSSLRLAR